jgi:Sulfatase
VKRRWFLEALGVALLLSLPYFAQLLFPGSISLYHHHRDLRNTLCGLLLAMVEIAVLVVAVIAYFHYRLKSKPRAVASAAIATVVLLRATDTVISLIQQWRTGLNPEFADAAAPTAMFATATHFWFEWPLRLALVAGVAALAIWRQSITQPFVKATRLALAAFAFCLLWIVPQVVYFAYGLKPTQRTRPPIQAAKHKQIVWVLFDELSYKLIFEHPPDGMQFPNFNKLHAQSVSFSDVQVPGFYTDRIIPSVIAGKRIEEIESDSTRRLLYLNQAHHWVPYDQNDTLFGIAQAAGWNSGIAGWYNPYCRIFPSVLDSCLWEPSTVLSLPIETVGASRDKSIIANAQILVGAFISGRSPSEEELAGPRIRVQTDLMKRADELIRGDQIDFVFIHLPVPHPPGFYDRKTHKLCACGNYIDNLVLADDALGQLEDEIKERGPLDQTTLIVSSDHSWRIGLWRGQESWTPEEERISGGKYDPRPVLLVHFPGQESAINIASSQPELIEHDIIASMLQNKLNTSDDLVSFLQTPQKTVLAQSQQP